MKSYTQQTCSKEPLSPHTRTWQKQKEQELSEPRSSVGQRVAVHSLEEYFGFICQASLNIKLVKVNHNLCWSPNAQISILDLLLWAGWCVAIYLISPCLSSLIWKIGIVTSHAPRVVGRIKCAKIWEALTTVLGTQNQCTDLHSFYYYCYY